MATEITGALIDGSFLNRTLPIGRHGSKLFVIAYQDLHRNAFGGSGFNVLGAFKSTDAGATWSPVGGTLRTESGWFDACVDGRLDEDHPFLYVATSDTDRNWTFLRFNMATEAFDVENHFQARRVAVGDRIFISCSDRGEVRALVGEGIVTEDLFTHAFTTDEVPKYFVLQAADGPGAGSAGGPVPGMTFDGNYSPMAIAPGPPSGSAPAGSQGWWYVMVKAEYIDGVYHQSTRWFDDNGVEHTFDDSTDARTRCAWRHRPGLDPEAMILNFLPVVGPSDLLSYNYCTETINPFGELRCDQSQIPSVAIQGYHYTGGGLVLSRAGIFYLLWMASSSVIGYKSCVGNFEDCSSWTSAESFSVLPSVGAGEGMIALLGGGVVQDGLGVLFCDSIDPSEVDQIFNVKFDRLAISGDQLITGEVGIASEEAFGKTFGVDGDVIQCGTLNTDVIPDGCSEPVISQSEGNCRGFLGYSF